MESQTQRKPLGAIAPNSYSGVLGDTSPVKVLTANQSDKCTIHVLPRDGATCRVEFTTSPSPQFEPDKANWVEWPKGEVTEEAIDVFLGYMTGVRLTRIENVGTVVYEVLV